MRETKPVPRFELGGIRCAVDGCEWRRGFMLVVTGEKAEDDAEMARQSEYLTRASKRHAREVHGTRLGKVLIRPRGARVPKGYRRIKREKRAARDGAPGEGEK